MGLLGGHLHLHDVSEPFQGTILTQSLNLVSVFCQLLCLLATNWNSYRHSSLPISDICCHLGFLTSLVTSSFSLILIHALYTMSFVFLTPLRMSCSLIMLPGLSNTHQKIVTLKVAFLAYDDLTLLIFPMTGTETF